jgi:uncharacterized repeat protein (TIGR02543 family)
MKKISFALILVLTVLGLVLSGCPVKTEEETVTVTFNENYNGAPANITKTAIKDEALGSSFPADPIRSGYTFDGWYNNTAGTGSKFVSTTVVSVDITVYAKWILAAETVTVTFNHNYTGAPANTTKTVTKNAALGDNFPGAPDRSGYNFTGWYNNTAGTGSEFVNTTTVSADITVYAKWTQIQEGETFTVTFNHNYPDAPTNITKTPIKNTPLGSNFPGVPTRAGYTFYGWYDNAEGTGNPFVNTTIVSADITVYAKWTQAAETFTVTFDANGGTVDPATIAVATGGTVETIPVPSNDGKVFVAWFTSASSYQNVFSADTEITEDITLTAQWVDAVTYGPQEDGSYILDPVRFSVGYQAVVNGDTVSYSGGVADYLFPTTDFDITDYESLTIKYVTYAWTPEAEVSPNDNMQLVIKDWDGSAEEGSSRNDIGDYPTLQKGKGTFTIAANFSKLQKVSVSGFGIGVNVYEHSGIGNYTVKFYSITLNPKAETPPEGTFGKQEDGTYKLDPANFTVWYNAELTGGDTIAFAGGGVNYPFPDDDDEFDIADYVSLTVEYTTSSIPEESDKTLKLIIHTLKTGDTDYTRTNLVYPTLSSGDGTYTLLGTDFEKLQADGVLGFDFQINSDGGYTSFNMKIKSMTLMRAK